MENKYRVSKKKRLAPPSAIGEIETWSTPMISGHRSREITVSQLMSRRGPEPKPVTCVHYLQIFRPAHSSELLLTVLPCISVTCSPPPALFRAVPHQRSHALAATLPTPREPRDRRLTRLKAHDAQPCPAMVKTRRKMARTHR